jgi:peptidoglycan/LPS O-acetylase OafA/YrhL
VSKSIRHIPSLDGLRAVSFLLVFVAHAGLERFVPGGFGVTIFFFLSGFLITTLLRGEFERHAFINLRHFWLRRTLRILPPFYVVLVVSICLSLLWDPPGTLYPPAVVAQALQYTNYWVIAHGFPGQPAGTGVYWSLAVEEHFYLLFPWLFIALQKGRIAARNQALVLWGLCAIVLCWRLYLVFHGHVPLNRTYMASDTRVDSILFGCALAVWNNPVLDDVPMNERRWKFWYAPAAVLLLLACIFTRGDGFRETVRYSLQGAALTVLFIAAIRYHRWAAFSWLNNPLMNFIGLLSYSLYLLHLAVLMRVEQALPSLDPVLRAALALAMAVALAYLIYITVEKPAARWRRRLSE